MEFLVALLVGKPGKIFVVGLAFLAVHLLRGAAHDGERGDATFPAPATGWLMATAVVAVAGKLRRRGRTRTAA
jgi:hypothetical protein